MKKLVIGVVSIFACVVLGLAQDSLEEKENLQRTFAAVKTVEIDNLNGGIHIVGYSGGEVQLTAVKAIRARSPEAMANAKSEVKLDIAEKDSTLSLYVDGPFRCHCRDGSAGFREGLPAFRSQRDSSVNVERHPGYQVQYDFELKTPYQTNVYLRTVNHGDIRVENLAGDFDINNINGGVELSEVSGSGRAYALNRPLKALFSGNPKSPSYFGSLNGLIEVTFQPDLSADLKFKTFNGHVYTDFPVTDLPPALAAPEKRNGKFVYRSNGFYGVRVGSGGPELKFDAFNRDIKIIRRTK